MRGFNQGFLGWSGAGPLDVAKAILPANTLANRPTAAPWNEGFLFFATDTAALYRSDGSAWTAVTSAGSITSLNGLTATTQTFADVDDTNVTLAIASATSTHTFTMGWSGQLSVARGGTGNSTLSHGSILVGNDTSAVTLLTLTSGQIVVGSASDDAVAVTMSGDVTIDNAGATTIGNDKVTYAKMQNISATQRLLGRDTTGAGDTEEIQLTDVLDWAGTTQGSLIYRGVASWGELLLGSTNQVLCNSNGTDPGYVGLSTLIDNVFGSTDGSILYRDTGGLWAILTPGTSGYVLTSNGAGANPSYQVVSFAISALTLTDWALGDDVPFADASASEANVKGQVDRLAGFINPGICDFRLTLTSGEAVTTSDVTSAGTLYLTPYQDGPSITASGTARVALYDGTRWALYTNAEVSLALTVTSGTNYDVFLYDNSGTLTLELTAWTNDTTRATALALQDGVLVKSGATTRRYMGTIRASGSNVTEDSVSKRFVINYYHPVPRVLFTCPGYSDGNTSTTYTISSTVYAEVNGGTGSKVEFLVPLTGWIVDATASFLASNGTAGATTLGGLALDSTSTPSVVGDVSNSSAVVFDSWAVRFSQPMSTPGYHYLDMLACRVSNNGTMYADLLRFGASADTYATYLKGWVMG